MKLTDAEIWAQRLCVADLEDQPAEPIILQIQADALRFAASLRADSSLPVKLEMIANQLHPAQENKKPVCRGKLPDPTLEQIKCLHTKWKAMKPRPSYCPECELKMWDAGD